MSFEDQSGSGSSGFSPAPLGIWKDLELKRGDRALHQISGCLPLTRPLPKMAKKRGWEGVRYKDPTNTRALQRPWSWAMSSGPRIANQVEVQRDYG